METKESQASTEYNRAAISSTDRVAIREYRCSEPRRHDFPARSAPTPGQFSASSPVLLMACPRGLARVVVTVLVDAEGHSRKKTAPIRIRLPSAGTIWMSRAYQRPG